MLTTNLIIGFLILTISLFLGLLITLTYCISFHIEKKSSDYIKVKKSIENNNLNNNKKIKNDGNPEYSSENDEGFYF